MSKHITKCSKCNWEFRGYQYELPSESASHIKRCHKEDYDRLEEANAKLKEIKNEFPDMWFMHYWDG